MDPASGLSDIFVTCYIPIQLLRNTYESETWSFFCILIQNM